MVKRRKPNPVFKKSKTMVFPKDNPGFSYIENSKRRSYKKAHTPFFLFSLAKVPWTKLPPNSQRDQRRSLWRTEGLIAVPAQKLQRWRLLPWLPWYVGGIFLFDFYRRFKGWTWQFWWPFFGDGEWKLDPLIKGFLKLTSNEFFWDF